MLLTLTLTTAVLATAALISLSQFGTSGGPGDAEELFSGIPQSGTTLGRADAPVTISVYEDFQLVESKVASDMPESDLFAGVTGRDDA